MHNLLPAILGIRQRFRSLTHEEARLGQVLEPFPQHRFRNMIVTLVDAVLRDRGEMGEVSARVVAHVQAVREGRAVGRVMLQANTLVVAQNICDRLHHFDLHMLRFGSWIAWVGMPSSGLDPSVMRHGTGLYDHALHNVASRVVLNKQAVFLARY